MTTTEQNLKILAQVHSEIDKPPDEDDRWTNAQYHAPSPHRQRRRRPSEVEPKQYGRENRPKPGEISSKQWRQLIADQTGVSLSTVAKHLTQGKLAYPNVRRVNARVVFVTPEIAPETHPEKMIVKQP